MHSAFSEVKEKMTTNIEAIPLRVAEGTMTKAEAADIIWADIYLYPGKYGLSLTEDQKSDFLIYLRARLEGVFADFKIEKSKFRTYVWGLVKNTYQSWIRMARKKRDDEYTTRKSLKSIYDVANDEYYNMEEKLCAEPGEGLRGNWKKKEREMAEKAALILALKSCYDIDEALLESVSKFTRIKKEKLFEQIEKMKKKSEHKISRRDEIIRSRDNAFYFHRKYLIELSRLKEGTSSFERVQKKYRQQTDRWVRQNKVLSHRFVLAPSNVDIADELGMKPRQVCFYIDHIRKRKDSFRGQIQEEGGEDSGSQDKEEKQ